MAESARVRARILRLRRKRARSPSEEQELRAYEGRTAASKPNGVSAAGPVTPSVTERVTEPSEPAPPPPPLPDYEPSPAPGAEEKDQAPPPPPKPPSQAWSTIGLAYARALEKLGMYLEEHGGVSALRTCDRVIADVHAQAKAEGPAPSIYLAVAAATARLGERYLPLDFTVGDELVDWGIAGGLTLLEGGLYYAQRKTLVRAAAQKEGSAEASGEAPADTSSAAAGTDYEGVKVPRSWVQ